MPYTREQVREWSLVLQAEGIPHRLSPAEDGGWTLVVDLPHAQRANDALQAYAHENAPRVEPEPAPAAYGRTYVGVALAALLAAFYAVTGDWSLHGAWFDPGQADAAAMRSGEWWRAITALTLHADLGHVVSNVVTCAFFASALFAVVGPGVGAWLMLLSGAVGNAANAVIQPVPHVAVGASTAIFGAVGALAGVQFVRARRLRPGSALTPIAAGLLLFAWLGTGEHTDILAHLLGLLFGILFGGLAGRRGADTGGRTQAGLLVTATLVIAASWAVALGSP